MQEIKKFGVLQTAKVAAIFYLLIGIPLALIIRSTKGYEGAKPVFFILLPLVYCAIGFIIVAVFCLIYNFVAGKIGGIEIELKKDADDSPGS